MMSTTEQQDDDRSGFHFLNLDARRKLPEFQYKGEDRSLLYKYMLSPLAAFLVNRATPRSIAPNSITLFGLLWMITAYLVFWYFVPTLHPTGELPRWIFALNTISMLVYQTLDNMDGKQARRTGSSSPMGLLFDHGCDAINSIFGSANWIIGLGLNPLQDTNMCLALIFGPFCMFYGATWEEYYTGELILPIINGPTEGLLGGALLSLTTCLFGTEFWQSSSVYDALGLERVGFFQTPLRNADLQVLVASFGISREFVSKTIYVVRRHGVSTLSTQLFFLTFVGVSWRVVVSSPEFWFHDMPRTSLHLWAVLFSDMATQVMLDHISEQRCNVPQRFLPLLPLIALLVIEPYPEYLLVYATATWTYFGFKVYLVIQECCAVLNIYCFDITTQRAKWKTQ